MTKSPDPRLLALITLLALAACDSSSNPTCAVLGTNTYSASANFVDRTNETIAEFLFTQKVTSYESGGCDLPANSSDGVYLVVRNLTNCTLDINYTISVIQGRDGWTLFSKDSHVRPNAAEDIGFIHPDAYPRIDLAQILLSGTVTRSNCGGAKS
jgi:hypothetical protein